MKFPFSSHAKAFDLAQAAKLISILLMVAVAAAIYSHPYFIWSVPPVWLVLTAAAVLLVRIRELPVLASIFFLLGAATLVWSLTPANTLLNTLWETIYLAALTVGGSVAGFALLNGWLVLIGLERTLLLDAFNLTHYFSGSAHYLAGAQALLFIPFCLNTAVCNGKWSVRVAATLGAAACLLLILNSGARAVYWPAMLVLGVTLIRILLTSPQRVAALTIPATVLALTLAVAAVLPGPTVWVPLGMKAVTLDVRPGESAPQETAQGPVQDTEQKSAQETVQGTVQDTEQKSAQGTVQGTVQEEAVSPVNPSVGEEGGIGSRLKMWDQALRIGLERPLGTGTGSFRNTIHAFQKHPLIGFSSAHNVFIEVFSTGGWLRAAVLIALLCTALWNGWNSTRWPLALGAAGLWATMSFDITGQMPGIMVLGFWAIGTSFPLRRFSGSASLLRVRTVLASVSVLVGISAVLWWYLPCEANACATGRHLGYRPEVTRVADRLPPEEARALAQRALELNPESLWAWRLWEEQAVGAEAELAASRALAQKFPLASPELYLRWAENALRLDQPDEARRAIDAGLEVFPVNLNPAGVPFGGRGVQYGSWLSSAKEILERSNADQ